MFGLRDYPLSQRLTWMNLAVSGTALVLACAGFVAFDVARFRENMVRYVSTQARIVETNSISALVFDDPAAASRTVSALDSAPEVVSATIYDVDGAPFASYSRDGIARGLAVPELDPELTERYWFDLGEVALVRTILFEEEPVGYVYIRASLRTLYDRVVRYLGISVVVLAMSLAAALVVSSIFGRALAKPIKHLAEVADKVSTEKDYSVRAEASTSHDEVAVLIDAFNDMLGQIQERDSALQKARDTLEARVQERTARLKTLSGRLMELQDEERRHIARELHDSTGQVVAALSMSLAVLESDTEGMKPGAVNALKESVEMVQELSRELRTLSHLLHPPLLDVAGLESALTWYVHGFAERSGIHADVELPPDLGRLSRELETAVFRIVQESLTNVHRHSESPTASVRVSRNGHALRVEVRDEGKGMPTEDVGPSRTSVGIGIQGMRERVAQFGGELEIRSDANGTSVLAIFPD